MNGKWWSVKAEDCSVKIRRRLTISVFRNSIEGVTLFWVEGNVRDLLGGGH